MNRSARCGLLVGVMVFSAISSRIGAEVWNVIIMISAAARGPRWIGFLTAPIFNQLLVGGTVFILTLVVLFLPPSGGQFFSRFLIAGAAVVISMVMGGVIYSHYVIPEPISRVKGFERHVKSRITCQQFLAAADKTFSTHTGKKDLFWLSRSEVPEELSALWPDFLPHVDVHSSGPRIVTISNNGREERWGVLVLEKGADERVFYNNIIVRKWCDRVFFFFEVAPYIYDTSEKYRSKFEGYRKALEMGE